MGSNILILTLALSSAIVSNGLLTQNVDDTALRARFLRLRQIITECNCPPSCMLRLKMCLGSGECSSCKVPTYGKRSQAYPMVQDQPLVYPDYGLY